MLYCFDFSISRMETFYINIFMYINATKSAKEMHKRAEIGYP